jgi:uncharacterized membrane protein YphA (DoxX/SURF4 family)
MFSHPRTVRAARGSSFEAARMSRRRSAVETREPSSSAATSGLRTLPARYRQHSFTVLRVSVGLLFVWFGALKFLPDVSHAEDMATRVVHELTSGAVPADVSRPLVALMEILIGAGLVTGLLPRLTLLVFFAHMAGTFTALVVLRSEVWDGNVAVPTMAGQYVIKNVVLVAAGLAIAAHLPQAGAGPSRTAGDGEIGTGPDAPVRAPNPVVEAAPDPTSVPVHGDPPLGADAVHGHP